MGPNKLGEKTKTFLSKIKTSEPAQRFGQLLGYSSRPTTSHSLTKMNSTNTKGKKHDHQDNDEATTSKFECNICLEPAKDAVISMCGHLFCWPCLHQWFETRPNNTVCPVCKDQISREKVIPLYGRDSYETPGSTKDPRNKKYPPRPSGQRSTATETPTNNNFDFFANGGNSFFGSGLSSGLNSMFGGPGIHMAFGIGAFPFGFFTTMFNLGSVFPNNPPGNATTTNAEPRFQRNGENWEDQPAQSPFTDPHYAADDRFLSKMFLWVAILFILWLLLA